MPFETISLGITFQIPTAGTRNTAETLKTTFETISSHDHTGGGSGTQITAGALAANAVTGSSLRLNNNQSLRGRNQLNNADVDLIKVNTSDQVEFGAVLAGPSIANDAFYKARNNADSANVDIVKINTSDAIEFADSITIGGSGLVDGVDVGAFTDAQSTWVPTLSGSGSMTFTGASIDTANYTQVGDYVYMNVIVTGGTTGGTASTYLEFTLPVNTSGPDFQLVHAAVIDVSNPEGGIGIVRSSPDTVRIYRYDRANWGLGASRGFYCSGWYHV